MAINVQMLVSAFESALGCPYVTPGNTSMSTIAAGVDCSGLFVAAFKAQGATIEHGSNAIARYRLTEREKLTKTSQLRVGAAVFKWREDGDYPSKYHNDGMGNFHHIGLVVSVSPVRIIHASSVSGCVTTDTSIKNWKYVGLLKNVAYDEPQREQETVSMSEYTVKITATALRIRKEPHTKADVLGSLPKGSIVECSCKQDNWYKLANSDGYISGEFVTVVSQNATENTTTSAEPTMSLEARLAALEDRVKALEEAKDADY